MFVHLTLPKGQYVHLSTILVLCLFLGVGKIINGGQIGKMYANTKEHHSMFSFEEGRTLMKKADDMISNVIPDAIVAKDKTGNFSTINEAIVTMPSVIKGRYTIYIKSGIYYEQVSVTKDNVLIYGDGPTNTIISGNKSALDNITTSETATFAVTGNKFIAKSIAFQNTAGPAKHQAVALRVNSNMFAFFNCQMDGYQDTLYAQKGTQFYRECVISGTIDFIFGDATAVIQNCQLVLHKPLEKQQNVITAQSRQDVNGTSGFIIHNCTIIADKDLFPLRFHLKTYLGRPWKEYSRTIYMESNLGDFIQSEGWIPWNETNFALNTLFYAEYNNTGPAANITNRIRWEGYKVITNPNEALKFTVDNFIQGYMWLKDTGIPYIPSLKD